MSKSDPQSGPDGRHWYDVELRSGVAPMSGGLGVEIGGLKLRSVVFEVPVDEGDVATSGDSALRTAERYAAARDGAGAVAAGTDWPAGEYLVIVRGRESATRYVADIDQNRSYGLRQASD